MKTGSVTGIMDSPSSTQELRKVPSTPIMKMISTVRWPDPS